MLAGACMVDEGCWVFVAAVVDFWVEAGDADVNPVFIYILPLFIAAYGIFVGWPTLWFILPLSGMACLTLAGVIVGDLLYEFFLVTSFIA